MLYIRYNKNPKGETMNQNLTNLIDVIERFPDEKSCRDYLIETRWNNKPICYYCGNDKKIYKINEGKTLKCSRCRKQFSVKVGTIFENSAIPLQKWFLAIYVVTAHKKGIASTQLARDIGVTQKTAWFMLHRIRFAVSEPAYASKLEKVVEIDHGHIGKQPHHGRYDSEKVVLGMVQRQGEIRLKRVNDTKAKSLESKLKENIDENAIVISDESKSFYNLHQKFFHLKVNHSKQHVNGMIHTNTIDGFWSMLKRGIYGIYHHVDNAHLDKYCDEFQFRYNTRKLTDTERFSKMLKNCQGRLTYQELIKNEASA